MDTLIRIGIAFSIFAIMIGWEWLSPRRKFALARKQRWPVNLGLATADIAIMRLTIGSLAYLSAIHASELQYGLLHWLPPVPGWLAFGLTLLVLDFAIYCQHLASHKWPWFWRLHRVHHTDLAFDTTTAVRFHPLELLVSMTYKAFVVVLLGAHPTAVVVFEIILNSASLFNHSNVFIPERLDHALRWLIVTPDMHRIHHSTVPIETDSNYGFSVSWWDRLCRTYTQQPKAPQTEMEIGLKDFRNENELGLFQLIKLPFKALQR